MVLLTMAQHPSVPTLVYWQQWDTFPWDDSLLPTSPQTKSSSQHFAAAPTWRHSDCISPPAPAPWQAAREPYPSVSQHFLIKDHEKILIIPSWSCLCHDVTNEFENKGNVQVLLCFSPILFVCPFVGSGLCGFIQKGKKKLEQDEKTLTLWQRENDAWPGFIRLTLCVISLDA